MLKRYYLVILLTMLATCSRAQEKLKDNLFQKKLLNGLTVLVVEDHSVPLATLMLTFKAGAFTESDQVNGLTGLYQLMLSKGNKDRPNEMANSYYAGGLGISLRNSGTTEEYSTTYFTLPAAKLTEGLNFLNAGVRFPSLDALELQKTKLNISNSMKQKESNPYFALNEAITRHLWGAQYSRKTAIGDRNVIEAATTEQLLSIKNKYYYPNNAILIVGGDVSHEATFKEVEKVFGSWNASVIDPFVKYPVPEIKPLLKSDYVVVESNLANVPALSFYWHGPDTRTDPNATYAADVFSYIVNQNSSKLSQALMQSGLASSVSLNYLTLKYVGPISLSVSPFPAKIRECVAEIQKQITLMDTDDYLSTEKIETAKRMLDIKKIREEEVTSDFVHSLSFWWASASLKYYLSYDDNLQKVTRDDIRNYINKYIKNKPYCAGLLLTPQLSIQIDANSFFKP